MKITSQYYSQYHVLGVMVIEMREMSDEDYIFLQNCAPAHTAKTMLEYLVNIAPVTIPPNFWPPHSIDLNILDFSVLSDLKTRA